MANNASDTIPYVMSSKSLVLVVASDTTSILDIAFVNYDKYTTCCMVWVII